MQKLIIVFITLMLSSLNSIYSAKIIQDDSMSGDGFNQQKEELSKTAENLDIITNNLIKAKNDYLNMVQRLKLLDLATKELNPDLELSGRLNDFEQIGDFESRSIKGKPKRKTFFVGK